MADLTDKAQEIVYKAAKDIADSMGLSLMQDNSDAAKLKDGHLVVIADDSGVRVGRVKAKTDDSRGFRWFSLSVNGVDIFRQTYVKPRNGKEGFIHAANVMVTPEAAIYV